MAVGHAIVLHLTQEVQDGQRAGGLVRVKLKLRQVMDWQLKFTAECLNL